MGQHLERKARRTIAGDQLNSSSLLDQLGDHLNGSSLLDPPHFADQLRGVNLLLETYLVHKASV